VIWSQLKKEKSKTQHLWTLAFCKCLLFFSSHREGSGEGVELLKLFLTDRVFN
jgi:hypothetical protein